MHTQLPQSTPHVQRPQTGLSFTGTAVLPGELLPCSAHPHSHFHVSPGSYLHLLAEINSVHRLFSTRFPALVPRPCAWTSCHLSPRDIQAPFPPVRSGMLGTPPWVSLKSHPFSLPFYQTLPRAALTGETGPVESECLPQC